MNLHIEYKERIVKIPIEHAVTLVQNHDLQT